jgi:hypothetical protein
LIIQTSSRTNKENGYRAGYAESYDGKTWKRLDEHVRIEPSDNGWDSEAIAYPFVYTFNDRKYMLYNGNGFGKAGFGYAVEDHARETLLSNSQPQTRHQQK